MIIAHNLGALSINRNLNRNNTALSKSLANLSSGFRINTAADDPSGLIISEQLRAQTAGLTRAVQNTQEAQNVLGIAEGALHEISSILKKMKQLAVHAANTGVTSGEQTEADQAEIDSSVMTIDRIGRTTHYSDQFLLNGNKSLKCDAQTNIDSTNDFDLLDMSQSEFYQIDSYGQKVTLSFSGKSDNGGATMENQASKAYFEIDSADNRLQTITRADGITVLSADQAFTLTGNDGSRYFSFAAGTSLGEISDVINSTAESVGVEASLIFNSAQKVDMLPYTTTSTVTNLGIQTDGGGGGGLIPIFPAGVQGVTGMGAFNLDPTDKITTYTVRASDSGLNGTTLQLVDNLGAVLATQNYAFSAAGPAGNATQNVTLTSGNGTSVTFDYNYGYSGPLAAGVNNHNVMTDGAGGTVIAGAVVVNSSQNIVGSIDVDEANGADTSMAINAALGANPDEVIFTVTGNNTGVLHTETINLAALGVSGTGSQNINLAFGGSNINFDYYYDNDTGANYDRPTGNLFDLTFGTAEYDRPDGPLFTFTQAGVLTNNNVNTDALYTGATAAITGLPATATVDSADNVGTPWTVTANRVGSSVDFTLSESSGTITNTINIPLPEAPDIGIVDLPVHLTAGNGTSIDFTYHYESDNAKDAYDLIPNGDIARFDRNGALTFTNGNFTNGPTAANVTSPSAPVNAAQNIASQINIFDVVNGETPFTISAAAGAAADEVVFTLHGNTTDPLVTQTVNLNTFGTASTGSQAISIETDNGSLIEFDYFYENDPTTGEFDRPVGDLFTVDAVPVNSERLFDGITQKAKNAGASIDINLDPTTGTYLQNLEYGKNTDGQGRLFVKVVEHDLATQQLRFELYKSADYSPAALVGWGEGSSDGTQAITIHESNDSNMEGEVTFDDAGGTVSFMDDTNFGNDAYIGIGGIWGVNGMDYDGSFELNANSRAGAFNIEETVFSGIALGQNTDSLGQIYFKTVFDGANSGQVFAYKNELMRDEDLVAMSEASQSFTADSELTLNAANNSGLGIITRTGALDWGGNTDSVYTGKARCEQLGVRISTSEYGSEHYLQLQQLEGGCWEYYDAEGEGIVVGSNSNSVRINGTDAVVSINGQEKTCNGLELYLATLGMSGHLVLNEGNVGATTVAQVGYSQGSVFTNAKFLTNSDDGYADDGTFQTFKAGSNLVNAGNNTLEVFSGFSGGMQLQLGEGSGGQERTVLGVSSATALDLGKIKDGDTLLSLNDLLGGKAAALTANPVQAMKVIDQAINDVADLRARLGAWQSNLLQTNSNNLEVAIEKITKTESYIRDADMATESTIFSRNQIMVQAGTSMLAQANAMNQNVLSLLS